MICFPNAKINLGLRILRKREDGFHDIETIFYPIGLSDALEVVPSENGETIFTATGIKLDGNPAENLVLRAWRLIQQNYSLPGIKIHLHKVIPAGAGLGGGSSDAAFLLKLARRVFAVKVCGNELQQMAAGIGSDCSFFIDNKPAFASGKGDLLTPASVSLRGLHLLLIKPAVMVPTPLAYKLVVPSGVSLPSPETLPADPKDWNNLLANDFETAIFAQFPEIGKIKQMLLEMGALYASMSGSGSAVFGLFLERPATLPAEFREMFVWQEQLT